MRGAEGHLHGCLAGDFGGFASGAWSVRFHVGKPGAGAAGVASKVLDSNGSSRTVDLAFGVVRFLNLLLILLCVGGTVMLALALRDAPPRIGTSVWWAVAGLAALLSVGSLAWIGLEGAEASGLGLGSAFRPSLISDIAGTRFGEVWLSRAVVAAALTVAAVVAARSGTARRAWLRLRGCVRGRDRGNSRVVGPRPRRGLLWRSSATGFTLSRLESGSAGSYSSCSRLSNQAATAGRSPPQPCRVSRGSL